MSKFNQNDRNMVTSPYFYLEQDDIIYVGPNGVQKQNAVLVPQPAIGYAP